jgi:hypothetical protein
MRFISEEAESVKRFMRLQEDLTTKAFDVNEEVSGLIKYLDDLHTKLKDTLSAQGVEVGDIDKKFKEFMSVVRRDMQAAERSLTAPRE